MKKIHLYSINNPGTCKELTGAFLTPPELASGRYPIPKEEFKGTEEHLKGYQGKWHIEVQRDRETPDDPNGPFSISVFHVGPYGRWAIPARVYLVLEDAE